MEEKSVFENFELEVGSEIKSFLKETASWSYFLSILGFIGIGFMVFGGLAVAFAGGMMSDVGSEAYGVGYQSGIAMVYIIMAIVYFFPVLYLFKFSKKMKSALTLNNNSDFKESFSSLKSHYKFLGIFTIVIIALYILIIIGVFAGASMF